MNPTKEKDLHGSKTNRSVRVSDSVWEQCAQRLGNDMPYNTMSDLINILLLGYSRGNYKLPQWKFPEDSTSGL